MRLKKLFWIFLATTFFGCTGDTAECECKKDQDGDVNQNLCKNDGSTQDADLNPSTDEICDGIDNDKDGETDEEYPERSTVCTFNDNGCPRNGFNNCKEGSITCKEYYKSDETFWKFNAITVSCQEIRLSWINNNSNVNQSVILMRRAEKEISYSEIAVIDSTIQEFTDRDLRPNETYSYMIKIREDEYDYKCNGPVITKTANINTTIVAEVDEHTEGNVVIDVDSDNKPHIFFCNGRGVSRTHLIEQSNWSSIETFGDTGCAALGFALDNNAVSHVTNFEACGGGSDPDFWYYNDSSGEFQCYGGNWFVWCNYGGFESTIAYSDDNKISYFDSDIIRTRSEEGFSEIDVDDLLSSIELVYDHQGRLYSTVVAYKDSELNRASIYFITFDIGQNVAEIILPEISRAYEKYLIMDFDSNNVPHGFFIDNDQENNSIIMHIWQEDGIWLQEDLITLPQYILNCQSFEINQEDNSLHALCGGTYIVYKNRQVSVIGIDIPNSNYSDGALGLDGIYHRISRQGNTVQYMNIQSCSVQ